MKSYYRLLALLLFAFPSLALAAPKVLDDRLVLEEVASNPLIVTPTGIAVDAKGRVFVVESHTHFPPKDYKGPKEDRIRVLIDDNGDGKADRAEDFYDKGTHTMSIAFDRDGSLLVATRMEIFRLRDTNGDGKADQRTTLLKLDTPGNYPHNGLAGFSQDAEGNLFIGFGENLGAPYKLIGSDGTTLSGGAEGGNIYRCANDGSKLVLWATGFWNPFHTYLDVYGRLFTVDNDPDSRPPCRLIHVVRDGDYGYRFRNGRRGTHPFTSWNGELPGTLGMISGTGEAPSAVMSYDSDNFPADYRGKLLVTSWGDHRIEQYELVPRGASYVSTMKPIITGGSDFRPVGLALAPDGSLYFSDWVDKSYNLHGKGRVWRLRAKKPGEQNRSAKPEEAILSLDRPTAEKAARELAAQGKKGIALLMQHSKKNPNEMTRAICLTQINLVDKSEDAKYVIEDYGFNSKSLELRKLAVRLLPPNYILVSLEATPDPQLADAFLNSDGSEDGEGVLNIIAGGLNSDDPFLQHAARVALLRASKSNPKAFATVAAQLKSSHARAALVVAWRKRGGPEAKEMLKKFLTDPSPVVRFIAVQWVAEENLTDLRKELKQAIEVPGVTRQLFQAYISASESLGSGGKTAHEQRGLEFTRRILTDKKSSNELRRLALQGVKADDQFVKLDLLTSFLETNDLPLQLETVFTLRERTDAESKKMLAKIAGDAKQNAQLRACAVMGLSAADADQAALLLELATGSDAPLARQALTTLRGAKLASEGQDRLKKLAASGDVEVKDRIARVLEPAAPIAQPEPTDLTAWKKALAGPGDPQAGQRVFFEGKAGTCSRCHQAGGRGALIGPDLTGIAATFTEDRMLESILQPSKEIAPQFASWNLVLADGRVFNGLLVNEELDGTQVYTDAKGEILKVKPADIESRQIATQSVMPDGLSKGMTLQEFRDLLAFLRQK